MSSSKISPCKDWFESCSVINQRSPIALHTKITCHIQGYVLTQWYACIAEDTLIYIIKPCHKKALPLLTSVHDASVTSYKITNLK